MNHNRIRVGTVYLKKEGDHVVEIPYLLYIIYMVWSEFDPTFKQMMDIHDPKKRPVFLFWWIAYGLKYYTFDDDLISEVNWNYLNTVTGMSIGPLQWTNFIEIGHTFERYLGSTDKSYYYELNSAEGLKFFFSASVPKRNLISYLSEDQIQFLLANDESFSDVPTPLSRLEHYVYWFNKKIHGEFDLSKEEDRKRYKIWFETEGKKQDNVGSYYHREVRKRLIAPDVSKAGVNLIGHVNSFSGVGEDIRMAAMAFASASVHTVPVSFSAPTNLSECCFNINLFCLTGFQVLLCEAMLGDSFFGKRFNIGYFPWELSEWPKELIPALDLCDELWVSSRFIYDSIKPFTKKPVLFMPMAVELPEEIWEYSDTIRTKKNDEVTFLFMFDFISGIERKNAWACIESFQQAFQSDEKVSLVIKTINHQPQMPAFQRLLEIIKKDQRMSLVADALSRLDVLKLVADSDVFLSLHRSEGFGRGIAESLLLGKHVVVTHYSGNVDFCLPAHSFLVDYDLVPVKANEYVFSKDQVWAQVRIEDAALKIRQCYQQIISGNRKNVLGQSYIKKHYSKEVVGKKYAQRLIDLGKLKS